MLRDGLFSVPYQIRKFIIGSYRLVSYENEIIGEITIKDNGSWGIGPTLRRRGCEEGDYLILIVDIKNGIVKYRIGDEYIIDDYRESVVI